MQTEEEQEAVRLKRMKRILSMTLDSTIDMVDPIQETECTLSLERDQLQSISAGCLAKIRTTIEVCRFERYGEGEPQKHLILNRNISKA